MRRVIGPILLILSLFASLHRPVVAQDAAEEARKKLAGTWDGYAVENEGENPNRGPVHLRLIIDGETISAIDLSSPDKDKSMGTGTFQLDLSKELKVLDATGVVLPGKREKTYLGIYEVDGDTLKWCVDNRAKERPTAFRTFSGKYLLILKRQK